MDKFFVGRRIGLSAIGLVYAFAALYSNSNDFTYGFDISSIKLGINPYNYYKKLMKQKTY